MRLAFPRSLGWIALGSALAMLPACEWNGRSNEGLTLNQPPTVRITGGAAEGRDVDYRIEFFWFGSDVDGTVEFFLYAIDDTCLCRYEVETPVYVPDQDTTIVITEWVEPLDADSCRARGIEPHYDHPDSIWKPIQTFSGSFFFDATTPLDGADPPQTADWHTFYVKAVDNRNGISKPDFRHFNAVTIAPTVEILAPLGSGIDHFQTVSRFFNVRWHGRDEDSTRPDKKPVGYQLKMVRLDHIFEADDVVLRYLTHPFISRQNQLIPPDQIVLDPDSVNAYTYLATDWWPKPDEAYPHEVYNFEDILQDNYAIAVRAVDQAGAIMPDVSLRTAFDGQRGNVIKLDVNNSIPAAPIITVREPTFLGERDFWGTGQIWQVEVPVNAPLRFEWTASADHYGARVAGTNFALDIPDPGCEVCLEPDGIGGWIGWGNSSGVPFDIIFTDEQAGEQHVLYVRARDESFQPERETMGLIVIDVVAFSFDQTALWIDDFKTSGMNDCEHDAIVGPILNYAVAPHLPLGEELGRFDARRHTDTCAETNAPVDLRLSTMARYKVLFWNAAASGGGTSLGRVTDPRGVSQTGRYLSTYVRAGGSVVVWGVATIGALLGDLYSTTGPYAPELPQFPDANFGPGSFVWDMMRARTAFDRVGRGVARNLQSPCSGIVGFEATESAISRGFPPGVPDPTDYDPDRSAIWFDAWTGARNPHGATGPNVMMGSPPLLELGLDTLYTYISNSWAHQQFGTQALREVCGSGFLSPFEGEPIVVRYKDPAGVSGSIIWIGTPLHYFAGNHLDDLKLMMRRIADGVLR